MKTKLVYVASPYTAVFDALGARSDNVAYDTAYGIAKNIAFKGVENVRARNDGKHFLYVPISPVIYCTQVYGCNPYVGRGEIMRVALGMLEHCDEVFVVKSEYTLVSLGIKEEVAVATSLGIPVLWE